MCVRTTPDICRPAKACCSIRPKRRTSRKLKGPFPGSARPPTTKRAPSKCACDLPNPTGQLRANTFGLGRIVLRTEPQAIVVPTEAVHSDGDCNIVFVRDKNFFRRRRAEVFPRPRSAAGGSRRQHHRNHRRRAARRSGREQKQRGFGSATAERATSAKAAPVAPPQKNNRLTLISKLSRRARPPCRTHWHGVSRGPVGKPTG